MHRSFGAYTNTYKAVLWEHLSCIAGHEKLQEVVQTVFAYISMLNAPGGVTQARFEENKALSELRFRFADKNSPYNYVEKLSSAMQTYQDRYLACIACCAFEWLQCTCQNS